MLEPRAGPVFISLQVPALVLNFYSFPSLAHKEYLERKMGRLFFPTKKWQNHVLRESYACVESDIREKNTKKSDKPTNTNEYCKQIFKTCNKSLMVKNLTKNMICVKACT